MRERRLTPQQNLLRTESELRKTGDPIVYHYSDSRLSIVAKTLTVAVAVGSLLIPMFVLFLVPMSRGFMVAVALCFVMVFSITMSVVTRSRVKDVLFGTAT